MVCRAAPAAAPAPRLSPRRRRRPRPACPAFGGAFSRQGGQTLQSVFSGLAAHRSMKPSAARADKRSIIQRPALVAV